MNDIILLRNSDYAIHVLQNTYCKIRIRIMYSLEAMKSGNNEIIYMTFQRPYTNFRKFPWLTNFPYIFKTQVKFHDYEPWRLTLLERENFSNWDWGLSNFPVVRLMESNTTLTEGQGNPIRVSKICNLQQDLPSGGCCKSWSRGWDSLPCGDWLFFSFLSKNVQNRYKMQDRHTLF